MFADSGGYLRRLAAACRVRSDERRRLIDP